MPMAYYEPGIECASAGDLRAAQDAALAGGLIRRAMASALYRSLWQAAGVDPDAVRQVDDLRRLPYISGSILRQAWATYDPDDILCTRDVRTWFATSGTTGAPKWTPYGRAEVDLLQRTALRVFYMCTGGTEGLRCLVFGTPAPFISDGAGYFSLFGQIERGVRIEYVLTSYSVEQARVALRLVTARRPDAIIAFPSVALRLAEMIVAEAPAGALAAYRKDHTLRNLAAVLATRVIQISARHVLGARVGIFAGETLAPFREPLSRSYGLEPFELYAMTEFPCFHLDCREHAGMHLWVDTCVPEVITHAELTREEVHGTAPQAIPLLDAPAGTTGELVLTTFTEALPLIRYRTSDLVEVVATDRCGCGRTHPRVRILGRRDDLINMGLIRFSTVELETRLQALPAEAAPAAWQIHIVREGYKPRPILQVVPGPGVDAARLATAAKQTLLDIPVLRAGCDVGIVLEPLVSIVDRIAEERTWSGKPRRVIDRSGTSAAASMPHPAGPGGRV
ncbi:MAG: phenylacetate--CoA ligase family protein [Armatimonadota bacterium]